MLSLCLTRPVIRVNFSPAAPERLLFASDEKSELAVARRRRRRQLPRLKAVTVKGFSISHVTTASRRVCSAAPWADTREEGKADNSEVCVNTLRV